VKIACRCAVLLAACSSQAFATEPAANPGAEEYTLGRVFMSGAERRRLDLLRQNSRSTDKPEPASPASSARRSVESKPTKAAGYIIPSDGKFYQWVDGDFRQVDRTDASKIGIFPGIEITRHQNRVDNAKPSAKTEDTEPSTHEKEIDAEAGDGDRNQR